MRGESNALHAKAVRLHQAGKLVEAEAMYASALQADPGNPELLRLFGLLLTQTGRAQTAVGLIEQAIAAKPD